MGRSRFLIFCCQRRIFFFLSPACRRDTSYLIVFLILGLLAGGFWFSNWTRGEMGALERLYFRQYAKATAMSWISPSRLGKYTRLTIGAIGAANNTG
jgi:hypothetical protein